jgi:hypothetical protein
MTERTKDAMTIALDHLDTWLESMTSVRELSFTYQNERGEVSVHYTRNPLRQASEGEKAK